MKAPECTFCGAKHAPAVMRWGVVNDETPHPEQDFTIVRGPLCPSCGGDDLPTMADENEPQPTEEDFTDAAVTLEGGKEFDAEVESRYTEDDFYQAGPATSVPYGSTSVAYDSGRELRDEAPTERGAEVAAEWWDDERLEWAAELSPVDGSAYLVLADNNTPKEG